MKDLEKKLWGMKVPKLKDDPFETELRSKLVQRYFSKESIYKIRFKYAIGFACIMTIFCITTIIKPKIAYNVNQFAFKQAQEVSRDEVETGNRAKDLKEESVTNYAKALDEYEQMISNVQSSSIYNPLLTGKLDPNKYREDKTYLIRKYVSQQEGSVMIVSEFGEKPEKKTNKISY